MSTDKGLVVLAAGIDAVLKLTDLRVSRICSKEQRIDYAEYSASMQQLGSLRKHCNAEQLRFLEEIRTKVQGLFSAP